MNDLEDCDHEVKSVGDNPFGNRKSDKELQSVFRSFDLGDASCGLDYADKKKQHQKCRSNRFQCAVDRHDHIPDRAAFEGLR